MARKELKYENINYSEPAEMKLREFKLTSMQNKQICLKNLSMNVVFLKVQTVISTGLSSEKCNYRLCKNFSQVCLVY